MAWKLIGLEVSICSAHSKGQELQSHEYARLCKLTTRNSVGSRNQPALAGITTEVIEGRAVNLSLMKQITTLRLPPIPIDIDHFRVFRAHGCRSIPPRMRPKLVVIALIFMELIFQVRRSPQQRVIKELPPTTPNQSLNEWMRHRHMRQ